MKTNHRTIKGNRLLAAQKQAIDDLYSYIDEPTGRFAFYTENDSESFSDGTKNLARAELIHYTAIRTLTDEILESSSLWFDKSQRLMPIGIDCETTGLSPYSNDLIGVGLAVPGSDFPKNLNVIYMNHIYEQIEITKSFDCYFLVAPTDPQEYPVYLRELGILLERLNADIEWRLHNAKFDMLWLKVKTDVMLTTVEDSMCMAYLLKEPSLAIDKLSPKYLNRFPTTLQRMTGKDKKEISKEVLLNIPIQEFADYCAEDCIEGVLLCSALRERLIEESTGTSDLEELYDYYDKPSLQGLVWAESHGVLIDWEKLSDVGQTLDAEMFAIEEEIAINLQRTKSESKLICNSPKELAKVLYEELNLPTDGIKKGKTGQYSTDKEALGILRFLHPVAEGVFDYRVLSKLKGTYVDGLHKRQVNGIVHTTFENCITDTGRYSSTNPNLQNIPNPAKSITGKLLRQCFIARKGKTIVKADYSQFELRILAHFSKDPYLIECYKNNLDVHSLVTCLLFDIEYENFSPETNKQHKLWRTLVKTINFGLIYGMTAIKLFKMSSNAGLSYTLEECQDLMNRYWSRLPGVRDWMAMNRLKAIRDGYTETIFGRRRYFDFENPYLKALRGKKLDLSYENWLALESKKVVNDFRDQKSFRAIGNAPIQGSNADCIRRAIAECYGEWYGTETYLLLNVHDEIVLETPIENAMYVSARLKTIMEGVASSLIVPIVAEPTVALSWGDC